MRTGRMNRLTDLGELQLQVLDILMGCGTATVQSLVDRFPESGRPRYTTVLTVLRTLEGKGLVTHTTQDRTFHYTPTPHAPAIRGQVLREVLDRVFGGSPSALVATLLDTGAVTPQVLQELKGLIQESEGE